MIKGKRTLNLLLLGRMLFLNGIILSSLFALPGNTVWVSPNGDDNNGTGTEAAPYQTINFAMTQVVGGDTVLLKGGDYPENVLIGNKDAFILMAANPADTARIVAPSFGPAIDYAPGTASTGLAMQIKYLVLTHTPDIKGPGLQITDGELLLEGCQIRANTSDVPGAGIVIRNGPNGFKPVLRKNRIYNNTAIAGAGLYNQNGSLELDENTFYNNRTNGGSGGAALFKKAYGLTLTKNDFYTNTADSGAALAIFSNQADQSLSNSLVNNTLYFNSAAQKGGALYYEGMATSLVLDANICAENDASIDGGGVYLQATSSVILKKNIIVANQAGQNGGAVVINQVGAAVNIWNNNFTQNHADQNGGAIYIDGLATFNVGTASSLKNNFFHNRAGNLLNNIYSVSTILSLALNNNYWGTTDQTSIIGTLGIPNINTSWTSFETRPAAISQKLFHHQPYLWFADGRLDFDLPGINPVGDSTFVATTFPDTNFTIGSAVTALPKSYTFKWSNLQNNGAGVRLYLNLDDAELVLLGNPAPTSLKIYADNNGKWQEQTTISNAKATRLHSDIASAPFTTYAIGKNVSVSDSGFNVHPLPNQTDVGLLPLIKVVFSQEMDAGSMQTSALQLYGESSGRHSVQLNYDPLGRALWIKPLSPFVAGEKVRVVLSGEILHSDKTSINGYSWNFRIGAFHGRGQFTAQGVKTVSGQHQISFNNWQGAASTQMIRLSSTLLEVLNPDGNGAYQLEASQTLDANFTHMILADLDRDGRNEIVLLNDSDVRAYSYGADATFLPIMDTTLSTGSQLKDALIADFDMDGQLDFTLLRDQSDFREISYYKGAFRDGVYHLTVQNPTLLNGPGAALGFMDVDLDGQPDITVLQGAAINDLGMLANRQGAFATHFEVFKDITTPRQMVNADVWRDAVFGNQREVIVSGLNSAAEPLLKIFNIDAGKALVEQYALPLTAGVNDMKVADLNSDGFNDLLLALDDGHIEILFSDQGNLLNQQMIVTQIVPQKVQLIDLDGDGDLDIFLSSNSTGNIRTEILINGDRTPRSWYVDALAPANGDGSSALPLRSINEAIARSFAGDKLLVGPGNYSEFLDIDHDLMLESATSAPVNLSVPGTAGFVNALIDVRDAASFELKNFVLANPQQIPGMTALKLQAIDNISVEKINLENFDTGIHSQKSTGVLNDIELADGMDGLVSDSSNVTINGAKVHGFSKRGMWFSASQALVDSGDVYQNTTTVLPGFAGIVVDKQSVITLQNTKIANNGNSNIYLDDATLNVRLSKIADALRLNALGGNGIVSRSNGSLDISNSLFVYNPKSGVDSEDGKLQITNSVLAFNDTLSENSGGGVRLINGTDCTIKNSVFLGNARAIDAGNSSLTVRYNDFYQNKNSIQGVTPGVGNLDQPPLFVYNNSPFGVDRTPDDLPAFKLAAGSPLLDSGSPLIKNGGSDSRSDMGIFGNLSYPYGITAVPDVQMAVADTALQLSWQLPGTEENSMLAGVAVFRSSEINFKPDTINRLQILSGTPLGYLDNSVDFGKNYYYKLAFIDSNGASMAYSAGAIGRPDTYQLIAQRDSLKVQLRVGDSLAYTIPLRNDSSFPFTAILKTGKPDWLQSSQPVVDVSPGQTVPFTLLFSAMDLQNDSLYSARVLFSAAENRSLEVPLDLQMLVSGHDQLLPDTKIDSFLPDSLQQTAFSVAFSADDTSRSTFGSSLGEIRYVYNLTDLEGNILQSGATDMHELNFYNLSNGSYIFNIAAIDSAGNGALGVNSAKRQLTLNLQPLRLSRDVWQLVTIPRVMAQAEVKPDVKEIRALKRWIQGSYFDINVDSLTPGSAYWVYASKIVNIDLQNFRVASADSVYRVPLNAGWNMIGNPWSWDIDWQRLNLSPVNTPQVVYSYEQAVNGQLISGDKTFYSSTKSAIGYDVEKGNRMRQGRGYWLYSKEDAILFMDPLPMQPETSNTDVNTTVFAGVPGMNKIVHLSLRDGPYIDKNNYFGVCDKPESYPYFFRNTLEPPQVFDHPRLYAIKDGRKITANLHAKLDIDSVYTWDILVENPLSDRGSPLLSWEPPAADNDVFYFLYHLESGTWFNMAQVDSFRIQNKTSRNHFKLFATPDAQFRPTILPVKFSLGQNYPNPFNPETRIELSVPFFADGVKATLDVYDALGRKIKNLINKPLKSGEIKVRWDGRNTLGQKVASGVYFYRFHAGKFTTSKKMVLLR